MNFFAPLLGGLLNLVSTFVGRVLLALGVTTASFTGVNTGLSFLRDQAFSHIDSLPPEMIGLFGQLQIGTCISMIAAAYTVRMVFSGASNGIFHKLIIKDL